MRIQAWNPTPSGAMLIQSDEHVTHSYVVYYRIVEETVEVIAVLHGSRDPKLWKSRA